LSCDDYVLMVYRQSILSHVDVGAGFGASIGCLFCGIVARRDFRCRYTDRDERLSLPYPWLAVSLPSRFYIRLLVKGKGFSWCIIM
jgi:hypothetical protein